MTDVKQAIDALLAAIVTARKELPRRGRCDEAQVHEAERHLAGLCAEAEKLIREQRGRIERRRRDTRSYRAAWDDGWDARLQEDRERHKLGLRLIDIGWKRLAAELHPDKGGSHADMARLNRVRDRLKTV